MLAAHALALLLAGCGEKTQKSAEDLQARYAQMQGYEAIVETAVPRGDETLHYTLSLEHSNGETRAAVLAPEELTGVGAVLEGDKLTLTFDDLVLDVGTLSPRVSALSCVPLVLQNFPKVYLDSSGAETIGELDALRADFSLTLTAKRSPARSGSTPPARRCTPRLRKMTKLLPRRSLRILFLVIYYRRTQRNSARRN